MERSRGGILVANHGVYGRGVVRAAIVGHLGLEPVDWPLPPVGILEQVLLDDEALVTGIDQGLDALIGSAAVRVLVVPHQLEQTNQVEIRIPLNDEFDANTL